LSAAFEHDHVIQSLPALEDRVLAAALLRWAHIQPDAPALDFPEAGVRWTYGSFANDAQRIAHGLRGCGLNPGDRIGLMLPNCPEYALGWYGSLCAGLIDVAVNHHLVKDMLAYQLRIAGVRAVITDQEGANAIAEVVHELPDLALLIVTKPVAYRRDTRTVSFSQLDSAGELLFEPGAPSGTVSIRYTSGTTGPAKAVAMTNSQSILLGAHMVTLINHGPGQRLYTCFPLHHGLSSILGIGGSLSSGGCCIVDDRFSASRYWQKIGATNATRAHILGPMVAMVLAQPASSSDRDHACTVVWTAPANPTFESRFGASLVTHYSMTEGNIIAYLRPGAENRKGSSGIVSPLFDVRIADEHDQEVPTGESGQILWRPLWPHLMMASYWGDPVATVAAWRGLWFHSGDEGRIDEDRYLYLVGRMGDQIRRKGVNIPAHHIEEAARRYEGVVDAAAIAVPSELGDSEVKLAVVVRGDLHPDPRAFEAFLGQYLPPEMVPRYLEFRADLPQTDTYKVSKARLRQEWLDGRLGSTVDLRGR
jgi:crotonobetaine/carnitine-CoA ligase